MNALPILYSFRRCPYAMRARMAIWASGSAVSLREVVLRNKPAALVEASPKATVPVLVLANGSVIEESIAIMDWALEQNDPKSWGDATPDTAALISACDEGFKGWLDKYKYADRHPEQSAVHYREQAEGFIADLEQRLSEQRWLGGGQANPGRRGGVSLCASVCRCRSHLVVKCTLSSSAHMVKRLAGVRHLHWRYGQIPALAA